MFFLTNRVCNYIFLKSFKRQVLPKIRENTVFCGYIKKKLPCQNIKLVRKELRLKEREKLIVVTTGGGEDGHFLIKSYLLSLSQVKSRYSYRTLIIFGSEMPLKERENLLKIIAKHSNIIALDFTDRLMNYLQAADLVVSMAGYNTITEILSLGKKAVVVPRHKPSQEQLIRALRMEKLGLLTAITPNELTIEKLSQVINQKLNDNSKINFSLNFDGLINIQKEIINLLPKSSNISPDTNPNNIEKIYPMAI